MVADRLGHGSIEITLDLYSHVSAALQRAAANTLFKRLNVDTEDASHATTSSPETPQSAEITQHFTQETP
ncbi:MAG: hypothetical protein WBA63_02485 [Thermomicrobiales bacterium]